MAKITAFIFDLDGVLTDTAECHYQGWKRLADEQGIPFTRQENEALRGVSRRESLGLLLKGRPVSDEQALEMMERKNSYYLELVTQMTPRDVLPGAREFLAAVRAAGMKIAIASASKNAVLVVGRLDLFDAIDILTDGNSVQRTKPAPDLFLFAAQQLDVEPAHAVVVEDAEAGIQAAKAAGMHSIGLGPVERVGEASVVLPDLLHASLPELLEILT
jgi:beta-phosphoglucomutase